VKRKAQKGYDVKLRMVNDKRKKKTIERHGAKELKCALLSNSVVPVFSAPYPNVGLRYLVSACFPVSLSPIVINCYK
jgi:hypothetical protein